MTKLLKILAVILLSVVTQRVTAQEIFVTEGETVTYRVWLDESIQNGTVSDALQNLPGVRVDMDGNITMRGVNNVEIFINDQASYLSDDARKNYLQQTPASDIKEIMAIVNPSAQYTTTSNTGIINIITKDINASKRSLNAGFQINTKLDYSPWLSYSYSKNKFTFLANAKCTYNNNYTDGNSTGISYQDESHADTLNLIQSYWHEKEKSLSLNVDFQVGYKFNNKNSINFYLVGEFDNKTSTRFDSTYRKDEQIFRYTTSKKYEYQGYDARAGLSYKHLFNDNGHSITLNFNTILMPGRSQADISRHYQTGNATDRTTREINQFSDFHWNTKIDYTLPYSKNGELYVGWIVKHTPDGNQLLYDTLAGNIYVRDSLMTEIRNYSTDKSELLINVQHSFGRFTVKPGVNLDYTVMTARYPEEHWYDFDKRFFTIHPSLYITYSTENQHNFSIGYTHKTDYPYVRKFATRILYQEDSYEVGNPDLKPCSTNVFRAEWTKYWERFGSVGINVYYKGSSDYINDVQFSAYNDIYGRYVIYNMPLNLGAYYDAGGEFNITYRPSGMLNARFYANLYNSHLEYPENDNKLVISDMFCYNLTFDIWTKLWNKLELHASAYYNSKTQTLYAYKQTPYGIDCGLRVDFFKNRMSLLINVNDLFDWNKTDNSINQPTYEFYSTEKNESRFISAEIIFKII